MPAADQDLTRDRIDAYRDYTEGVVRLMIFYLWHLAKTGNNPSVRDLLDTHVDILRKTDIYDGRHPSPEGHPNGLDPPIPEWDELKDRLSERIVNGLGRPSPFVEDDCWQVLEPQVVPRIRDLPRRCYSHGCWEYDVHDLPPEVVNLHFINAHQPDSPFGSKRSEVASSLRGLLEQVQSERPDLSHVMCFSWLNLYPPFSSFFPLGWVDSLKPTKRFFGNDGLWGQYMDHRGRLHRGRAAELRSTGRHPFDLGVCIATVSGTVRHLADTS